MRRNPLLMGGAPQEVKWYTPPSIASGRLHSIREEEAEEIEQEGSAQEPPQSSPESCPMITTGQNCPRENVGNTVDSINLQGANLFNVNIII